MEETKFTMELTIKEWDEVINSLTRTEESISKLKNNIVTGVNSQIAQINQAVSQVDNKQKGSESISPSAEETTDCGETTGLENEDNYNKTTTDSDTIGKEDEKGENK